MLSQVDTSSESFPRAGARGAHWQPHEIANSQFESTNSTCIKRIHGYLAPSAMSAAARQPRRRGTSDALRPSLGPLAVESASESLTA